MNIAYRTYLYTQDSDRIRLVPNEYFRNVAKKVQPLSKYANQDVQLIEAQIVAGQDGAEVLRSIKVWYLSMDDQGFVESRTMDRYDSAEIKKIEQDAVLKNNDRLVQHYIDGLFSDEPVSAELTDQTETITSRIWTIFRAVSPMASLHSLHSSS